MDENAQICHEVRARINQLNELSGTDLKVEMDDLKMVLLKNPVACSLLLPEDIGKAVRALKTLIFAAKESPVKPLRSAGRKPVNLILDMELTDD